MRAIPFVFAGLLAFAAQALPAQDTLENSLFPTTNPENLQEFVWKKRPVVVFADSPIDPAFIQQMNMLRARSDALIERDVVVLHDTDPAANGPLRQILRPRGFMLVIIGKEGGVKLRKPFPWDVREISRSIDKMPLRQQEIRDRKAALLESL